MLAAFMALTVFFSTYALVLPAITLDAGTAETEAGIEVEQAAEETSGNVQVESNLSAGEYLEQPEAADLAITETELAVPETETAAEQETEAVQGMEAVETEKETETTVVEESYAKSPLVYHSEGFDLEIRFDESEWQLPEDTTFEVEVLDPKKEKEKDIYKDYEKRARKELKELDELSEINASVLSFYELKIKSGGQEIEVPEGAADIVIKYHNIEKAKEYKDETILAALFEQEDEDTLLFDENWDNSEVISLTNHRISEVQIKDKKLSDYDNVIGLLVCPQPEAQTLTAKGEDYTVTAVCSEKSGIPEGAKLDAAEILPEKESDTEFEYDEYVSKTEDALGWEEGSAGYIRLFDISILDQNGEKVQPAEGSTVDVRIELADKEIRQENAENAQVVHFAEGSENGEVVENLSAAPAENGEEGMVLAFETGSFSIYAVVDGPEPYEPPEAERITTIEDLAGQTNGVNLFVERNNTTNYFTDQVNGKNALIENNTVTSAAAWFFEPVEGMSDQFRIYTQTKENGSAVKKYIKQTAAGSANIELSGEGSIFEVSTVPDDSFMIKLAGQKMWLQHSNGGGGIRLYKENTNAANCRIKASAVTSEEMEDDFYKLDGQAFGMMYYSSGTTGEALMGKEKNGTSLQSLSMLVRTNTQSSDPEKIYIAKDSDISMWTFESVNKDFYKLSAVVNGEIKYLKISGNSLTLTGSEEASEIQFVPGSGVNERKFRLVFGDTAITYDGSGGFKIDSNNAGNEKQYMSFTELSKLQEKDFVLYSADKVSVSDLDKVKDGTSILVYKRVWNDTEKRYEYFAVDPNGNLVPCFERGDSIEWVGPELNDMLWTFIEHHYAGTNTPNYYYDLYNPYSQKYLAPGFGGEEGGTVLSDKQIGLNLSGRRYNDYYTTILAWDDPHYAYAGLKSEGDKVVSCPIAEAEDFYFAIMHNDTEDELTEVDTVDHIQNGITMRIADYGNTAQTIVTVGSTTTSKEQHTVLGESVYDQWNVHHLLSDQLDENGYPTSIKTGKSLGELYQGARDVNHLFLQETYEGTGYYEYDSTQNFAHLNADNTFTVYKEIGTMDNGDKPSLKHGQFMPFNDLKEGVYASRNGMNLYDAEQNPLSDDDPRKYEQLYLVKNPDYYFGVELEASFVQTPDGLDEWGHDIIYEFTGDDDFWLYVDGELVIDLGGIHSALPGKVNYRTGEVEVNGTRTTLYDIFRTHYAEKNKLAENDPQVTAYLDSVFKRNDQGQYVFQDYSTHTMKIFFMERGAGASNLHMRFNLTSVRPDQVLLQKKVTGSDKLDYDLAEYAYQIYYRTTGSDEAELRLGQKLGNVDSVIYPNSNIPVKYLSTYTSPGGNIVYQDVFFLSAGETAAINLPSDVVDYRIVECGVNTQVYENVLANDEPVEGTETGDEDRKDYSTDRKAISERQRVEFENQVNQNAIRTLTIDKELYEADGVTPVTDGDNTGFSYRLYLGHENEEELETAYMHEYYVKDPLGNYCRFDYANARFESLDVKDFENLTDEQITLASFNTSSNGTISRIPAGYQVEVRDLLVGTRFKVEERASDIPEGYALISYEREGSSYIVEDGEQPNLGMIRENESPAVVVKNKRGFGLTVKKAWSDASFVDSHGDIYFAVYYKKTGESVYTLKPGTVRVLEHPNNKVYYYYDSLEEGLPLSDYQIMEVQLTGDLTIDDNGYVTGYDSIAPVGEGEQLHVTAKPKDKDTSEEFEYTASYAIGEPTGFAHNAKTDTVTNSRHGIRLVKQDWTGQALQGADFELKKENGDPFGAGSYTSGEDGEITIAYVDMNKWYTLTEVKAPAGYTALEQPLQFRLVPDPDDPAGERSRVEVKFEPSGDYSQYYSLLQEDKAKDQMASITVKNLPFEFQTIKTGIRDGVETPLDGAVFALKVERTVDGKTAMVEVEGLQNLTSAETTGLLAGVDQSLAPGTYELTENSVPEGYAKLDKPVRFTISETGVISLANDTAGAVLTAEDIAGEDPGQISGRRYTLKIQNQFAAVPIILQKTGVDSATGEVVADKLGGAEFTIYTDAEHKHIAKWTDNGVEKELKNLTSSDETGIFFSGKLNTGTYYLQETDVPDGYLKLEDDVILTVSSNMVSVFKRGKTDTAVPKQPGGTITIQVENYCGYKLPSTGGNGNAPIYLAGIMFTGLAGAGLIMKKRKMVSS